MGSIGSLSHLPFIPSIYSEPLFDFPATHLTISPLSFPSSQLSTTYPRRKTPIEGLRECQSIPFRFLLPSRGWFSRRVLNSATFALFIRLSLVRLSQYRHNIQRTMCDFLCVLTADKARSCHAPIAPYDGIHSILALLSFSHLHFL